MEYDQISFEVLGVPAAKGNARAFVNKATGKAVLSSFGSGAREKKLRSWDAAVREAARAICGERDAPMFVQVPLRVVLTFRLKRPSGHWGKGKNAGRLAPSAPQVPTTKPDSDKLARSTIDPLHGIVFDDDARIVELVVRKVYARPGDEGAVVVVEQWRPE
jgi:Holliday junction resolvase RusA-like endonuclease